MQPMGQRRRTMPPRRVQETNAGLSPSLSLAFVVEAGTADRRKAQGETETSTGYRFLGSLHHGIGPPYFIGSSTSFLIATFRLPIFFGDLAASELLAAHGAPQRHADKTLTDLKKVVNDLQSCASRTGARIRGVPLAEIHSRTLCPSRFGFDHDRLRVPENLTTVECSCQGQLCLPIGDYRCTTLSHRFPVEYKNGTRAIIELPVACACAFARISSAYTGLGRNS